VIQAARSVAHPRAFANRHSPVPSANKLNEILPRKPMYDVRSTHIDALFASETKHMCISTREIFMLKRKDKETKKTKKHEQFD
jgi:hypothetical protein